MSTRFTKKSKKTYRKSKKVPKSVKTYVKKVVAYGGDRQYHDFTVASGTAMGASIGNGSTTTPLAYEITRISTGTGLENKEGSQIQVTGVRVKGLLAQAAVGESNRIRCLVFSLKNPPGYTVRTFANLAAKLWGSASTTADWLYNPVIPHETKVYWDHTWVMTGSRNPTNFLECVKVDKWLNIRKKIQYTKDGATAGASEAQNPIFVVWLSDSSAVPNPGFEGGLMRIYYRDS